MNLIHLLDYWFAPALTRITDRAIRELIETYETIPTPTNVETLAHLKALQFCLMKNDFDNWDN
jgi:hypothetical protein